jgi:endonuclease/exonuclease/phosphatase family metal-dependent hydrolase
MTNTLTLATFNLYNYAEPPYAFYEFSNIYSQDEWSKKQRWIAGMLAQCDADIIGFQEVFSPASLEALARESGYPYFAVVDQPEVSDGYLCSSPVQAIASRFPVKQVKAVNITPPFNHPLANKETTRFSRTPLHATVCIDGLGLTDVLVVHLKSQRPTLPEPDETENRPEGQTQSQQTIWGSWLSTIQRGLEANLIYSYVAELMSSGGQPVVVLGDFNQSLMSSELSVLTRLHQAGTDEKHSRPCQLFDSWALYCNQFGGENLSWSRPATHYHGTVGKTLDYILLSEHFDPANSHAGFTVSGYQILDEHLINPRFETDQFASDHAVVAITLTSQ